MTQTNLMKNENINLYCKSEQCTYFYYVGRLALFESDMKKAQEYLNCSYQQSLSYKGSNAQRITRCILKYLIVANIHFGRFPTV